MFDPRSPFSQQPPLKQPQEPSFPADGAPINGAFSSSAAFGNFETPKNFETPAPPLTTPQQTVFRDATMAHMPAPDALVPPELPGQSDDEAEADEQISALFTAMGRASQLSPLEIATRLQTTVEVISALEAGHLGKLPEWEELSSIVERYAGFMNIDERPILRRLREQLTDHYLSMMSRHGERQDPAQSLMPMSDAGLKSFANGNEAPFQRPANDMPALAPETPAAVAHSFAQAFTPSGLSPASLPEMGEQNVREMQAPLNQRSSSRPPLPPVTGAEHRLKPQARQLREAANMNGLPPHMKAGAAAPLQQSGIAAQHFDQPEVGFTAEDTTPRKRRLPMFVKIVANTAFLLILLAAFINWQPNRFWSGVDQLPKPIANSIYKIFEIVMPDPLAMSYRMNWVMVEDPRLRKADRLSVPQVKSLPPIDFSNLGVFNK